MTTVGEELSNDLESVEILVAHEGTFAVVVGKLQLGFHQQTVQHPTYRQRELPSTIFIQNSGQTINTTAQPINAGQNGIREQKLPIWSGRQVDILHRGIEMYLLTAGTNTK